MPEIAFVRFGPFYPLRILIVAWKENYKNLPLYTVPWLLRAGVCLKEPRLYSACIIHFYFCDNLIFFRCIFMIKTWSRCFWEGKQARKSKIPFSAWSWIKNKFKLYKTKKVVNNNPWINVANKWTKKKNTYFFVTIEHFLPLIDCSWLWRDDRNYLIWKNQKFLISGKFTPKAINNSTMKLKRKVKKIL